MFGHVNSDVRQRGRFFLFYAAHGISGGAVLTALVAGDAALALEATPQEEAVADVMALLRGIFSPQGVVVPEPLQVCVVAPRGCLALHDDAVQAPVFHEPHAATPQPHSCVRALQATMTRWSADPMCWGSYSSVAVGSPGAPDYDALAQPLGGRVFFAGEATTSK
jgi:lysine-specific histone demethylase 1